MVHFGLSDAINATDLTSSNKNLDVHMEKNTEFGAMAILSASSYGNKNKITSGATTTGNASGIVMNINKEWVASGAGLSQSTYAKNAKTRYINNDYTTTAGGKYHVGDALDIGAWHGGTGNNWIVSYGDYGFVRAYSGSIFSYCGYSNGYDYAGNIAKNWASRAAIVVGSGI